MPEVTFTDEETWFNGLAGVVIAAGGLITDPAGRVLLVKPNYRQFWGVPGGICELREPPILAAAGNWPRRSGCRSWSAGCWPWTGGFRYLATPGR